MAARAESTRRIGVRGSAQDDQQPEGKSGTHLRQSLLNEPRQCAHERPRIQGVDGFTTDNIGGIKARCGCEAMSLMSCRFRLWLAPN
jgi:hypothetical protein